MNKFQFTFSLLPGGNVDEAATVWIGRTYGQNEFGENIHGAPVALQNHRCRSRQVCLESGIIPVGQYGDAFSAKSMAEYLMISHNTELRNLLDSINRVGQNGYKSNTCLSALMWKRINNSPAEKHPAIFAWAQSAIHAIVAYENSPSVCTDFVHPADVLKTVHIEDERVRSRLTSLFEQPRLDDCLEVGYILRAMKVAGVPDEEVRNWLRPALCDTVSQDILFQKAVRELKNGTGRAFSLNYNRLARGIIVRSDNIQMANASRISQFGYAICITITKNGNVSIIPNHEYDLDMNTTVACIRLLESRRLDATYGDYSREDIHDDVPHWCYWKGRILNGSLFFPQPPTKLSERILEWVVGVSAGKDQAVFDEIKQKLLGELSGKAPAPSASSNGNRAVRGPYIPGVVTTSHKISSDDVQCLVDTYDAALPR